MGLDNESMRVLEEISKRNAGIFVELREARSLLREMEHIRDIWRQDYEQLVQVAEMYVDAFGADEMLTATEALRLTMVRDAIARWRNRQLDVAVIGNIYESESMP